MHLNVSFIIRKLRTDLYRQMVYLNGDNKSLLNMIFSMFKDMQFLRDSFLHTIDKVKVVHVPHYHTQHRLYIKATTLSMLFSHSQKEKKSSKRTGRECVFSYLVQLQSQYLLYILRHLFTRHHLLVDALRLPQRVF